MSEFTLPIDIANRSCQHLGQRRIDRALGFNEQSRQAKEIGAVYDKLRRAESERNTWRFMIRRTILRPIDDDTMLLVPALWAQASIYFVGCVASDADGFLWVCGRPQSLNAEPGVSADWQPYFGPVTAALFVSTTTYSAGELVYTAAGDGTSRVYLSLQNGNADNPATATAWSATVTYKKDDVITRSAVAYLSLIDLNTNNDPASAPALWSNVTSYSIGNHVGGSDGVIYASLTNANVGNDPTTDAVNWQNTGVLLPWTTVFIGGSGSVKWRQIGGAEFPAGVTLEPVNLLYPVGAGPSSQSTTRNVFRLPANYLRQAPQDPKAGAYTWLGSPTNRMYDDWDLQDQYIVSSATDPIIFRFVANFTDVRGMNAMFCEMLAARCALATCETITQSTEKMRTIAGEYEKFGKEARTVNAIEIGPVEAPLDEYLACRY